MTDDTRYEDAAARMVERQLRARGLDNEVVLSAMAEVPRHLFVPDQLRHQAYTDRPLPIDESQTISQPYIVALMTSLARPPTTGCRALDVGTGSGYQAAVLAAVGCDVWSIEIVDALAASADARLQQLDYDVEVRAGDGYEGWSEHAPFDCIIVAAAAPRVPAALLEQLAPGGRLVIPTGPDSDQVLRVIERRSDGGYDDHEVIPVRFVPMTGQVREPAD